MESNDLASKLFSQVFVLLPTITLAAIVYLVQNRIARVSPNIPYAGEGSLRKRLGAVVQYGKDPVEFLRKTRKELGDVFCVDLIVAKIVFFLGPDYNKEILRAPEEELSFWEGIRWAFGPIVSEMADDKEWTPAVMKVLRGAFTKNERLGDYQRIGQALIDDEIAKWSEEESIPLFRNFSHVIIKYMLSILFGEEFMRKHSDELVPMMAEFERCALSPVLRVLPGSLWSFSSPGAALGRTVRRFDELVEVELQALRENPDLRSSRNDYLTLIYNTFGERYVKYYGAHCMNMVFAGRANMAMSLPWLFLHARRVPGALQRIHEDAALPYGAPRPFIEACFRETGRLYTNTTIIRVTAKKVKVGSHTLPKGLIVACSPTAMQRSDDWASDSQTWRPERFLKKKDYKNWFQNGDFIHFGLGQHACPGEKLARMMVLDVITKVWMDKYETTVVSGLHENEKGVDGVGAEPAWTEENFGTPGVRGEDVMVRVRRRIV